MPNFWKQFDRYKFSKYSTRYWKINKKSYLVQMHWHVGITVTWLIIINNTNNDDDDISQILLGL